MLAKHDQPGYIALMIRQVNIAEAKAHFSDLIERAEKGRSIIIARNGRPVAMLVPLSERCPKVKLGFASDLLSPKQVEALTRSWTRRELRSLTKRPIG